MEAILKEIGYYFDLYKLSLYMTCISLFFSWPMSHFSIISFSFTDTVFTIIFYYTKSRLYLPSLKIDMQ